ncbi:MAG TPA: hypothetical protein VGN35_03660 [Jatrophihabitantaceae bacterium]|jgi:hypothetical protein|nr:hypothetical protein [Jatrophihabitantaceae bacterium]
MRVPVECVPDPDVPGCGNVFVSVEVDDRIVRAAFDTGASRTLLIDLPSSARPVGDRETSGLFGTGVVTEWEVSDIRIGLLRAGPLTVHRIDGGAGRHPVVGLDVLGTGSWQLDLASRTLVTGAPSPRGSALRRTTNGHILTEMSWPTATATALWDTGAGITLIDRRFADAHPNLFEHAGSARGTDILGSQSDLGLARVSGYEIDGTQFAGHSVAIADLPEVPDPIDAVIGFPTINQARWTVDVPAARWCIEL